GGERLLEAKAVQAWHCNVQHGAARCGRIMLLEEFLWRRAGPNIIAPGAKQSRQPFPNARVVIDEIDSKFTCHDAVASRLGNENIAIAPPLAWFTRVSRPPCACMMVEQIVSPRPSPCS